MRVPPTSPERPRRAAAGLGIFAATIIRVTRTSVVLNAKISTRFMTRRSAKANARSTRV